MKLLSLLGSLSIMAISLTAIAASLREYRAEIIRAFGYGR